MLRLAFDCTLLSDLVLSSSPANEGFHLSLNYIPGAKFLGLAAKHLYPDAATYHTSPEKAEAALDLFHRGTVRFGDAHPVKDGQLTYPVPFAWHHEKGKKVNWPPFPGEDRDNASPVYLWHTVHDKLPSFVQAGKQLKQMRGSYLLPNGEAARAQLLPVSQNFAIKSAYDRDKLRAQDEQMYGYYALQAGTIWRFCIDLDDDRYAKDLRKTLTGIHRMGRSATSQYGRIEITPAEAFTLDQQDASAGTALLYAYSNLCFYDKCGHTTLQPSVKALGLPAEARIDWDRSQVRHRVYRTWNKKRNNRDAERLLIEKGSVLVLTLNEPLTADTFAAGVGAHRSEGMGQVLLNPSFLQGDGDPLDWQVREEDEQGNAFSQDMVTPQRAPLGDAAKDTSLLTFLQHKQEKRSQQHNIDWLVNDFVDTHRDQFSRAPAPSSSQWGQIRNIARNAGSAEALQRLLFAEDIGFLHTGQSKGVWQRGGRITSLETYLNGVDTAQQLEFLSKLAAQMTKVAQTATTE